MGGGGPRQKLKDNNEVHKIYLPEKDRIITLTENTLA
jgi:hypothetical protein